MLRFIVCPLAKTPLRFDQESMELVNDDLGVAYPIKNGIPRLVPTDGKLMHVEGQGLGEAAGAAGFDNGMRPAVGGSGSGDGSTARR